MDRKMERERERERQTTRERERLVGTGWMQNTNAFKRSWKGLTEKEGEWGEGGKRRGGGGEKRGSRAKAHSL